MSELTDRYVAATLRTIPEKQRADIDAELRGSIADAIDARSDGGEDPAEAERGVLTDLGDPDRLAAGYAGRPSYLIGPDHFFTYKRLLVVLLFTVVPIVVAVTVFGMVLGGEDIGQIALTAWMTAITLSVHVGAWTTLVFYLIDRYGGMETTDWSLDRLPTATETGEAKLGEMIATVAFLSLMVAGLALSASVSPFTDAEGAMIPFFDPELWPFWIPYFILVLVAEIVFEVVRFRVGRWTWAMATVNLVLNLLFAVPAIYLLVTDQVFNPAFFAEIGWDPEPVSGDALIRIVIASIALVAVWDVFSGYRKAWLRRRG
jgi:hypothetical protein